MSQNLFRAEAMETLRNIAQNGVPSRMAYGGRVRRSRKRSRGGLARYPSIHSYGMGSRKRSRRSRSRSMGGSRRRSRRSRTGGSRKRSRRSRSRGGLVRSHLIGLARKGYGLSGGSRKRSRRSRGAGPITDILGLPLNLLGQFGLGLKGKRRAGRGLSGGRKRRSHHSKKRGASIFGPIGSILGLGMSGGRRKRRRSHRGGAIDPSTQKTLEQIVSDATKGDVNSAVKDVIDILKLTADQKDDKNRFDTTIYDINREAIRNQLSVGNYNVAGR